MPTPVLTGTASVIPSRRSVRIMCVQTGDGLTIEKPDEGVSTTSSPTSSSPAQVCAPTSVRSTRQKKKKTTHHKAPPPPSRNKSKPKSSASASTSTPPTSTKAYNDLTKAHAALKNAIELQWKPQASILKKENVKLREKLEGMEGVKK